MGTQTWVAITIIITEVLIVLKFDWETVSKPLPPKIALFWAFFIGCLVLWTIWQFYLKPLLHWTEKRNGKDAARSESPSHSPSKQLNGSNREKNE
jgi:phosphatidylserine synthase 2